MKRKRCAAAYFSVLVLICFAAMLAASCSAEPHGPPDEEILARFNEIAPLSQELNEIFVGKGLSPTEQAVKSEYDIGAEYFEVSRDAPYRSIASLKAAAESVYSADYLKSVYIMAFEGVAVSEGKTDEEITPRYKEVGGALFVDINWHSLELRTVFDFPSAKVIESTRTKVKISIDYTLANTDEGGNIILTMINQEGVWLLDNPTF